MQPDDKPKLKPVRQIVCTRCSKKFYSDRKRKYCEPCAKIQQTEAVRRWWRLHRAVNTKHTIVCEVCLTEVKRTGARQKYCSDCAADVRREKLTAWRAKNPNYQKQRATRLEAARVARLEKERKTPLLLPEVKKETKQ